MKRKSTGDTELGSRIKYLREKVGLSQDQLAVRLDTDDVSVSRWETGANRPAQRRMKPLANILQVTLGQLLGDEPIEDLDAESLYIAMKYKGSSSTTRKAIRDFIQTIEALQEPSTIGKKAQ